MKNLNWMTLLLLLAVLPACGDEKKPAPPSQSVPVDAAHPVVHRHVDWDRYTGRLSALENVQLRPRVAGHIQSVHFDEGSIVKRGQLLFVIDQKPFEVIVQRSTAGVTASEAKLEQARAQKRQAEAEKADVLAREELAKSRLERAKLAVQTNAIAKEQVEIRKSELLQATAGIAAVDAKIALADAAIAVAEATLVESKAQLKEAVLQLSYCRVTSPIDGRINRIEATPGNYVDNLRVLTSIVSLDPIHCDFDANERAYLKYIRLDRSGERVGSRNAKNPVLGALADDTGFPHRGYIDFVSNQIDMQTGTIRGRAIFSNKDNFLTPGLFMTVQIPGSAPYNATMIPDSAISNDQSGKFVYVIEEGKAVLRPVVLGQLSHGLRAVKSGVTKDDVIVIAGLQFLRPGAPVTPTMKELKIEHDPNGLPDDYQPVPKAEWLPSRPRPAGETK